MVPVGHVLQLSHCVWAVSFDPLVAVADDALKVAPVFSPSLDASDAPDSMETPERHDDTEVPTLVLPSEDSHEGSAQDVLAAAHAMGLMSGDREDQLGAPSISITKHLPSDERFVRHAR
jgi:hypothetical protein